ncbi:MAG: Asp-tRNA(Asn)/Glu-tRNA(Gln) amidotransferase GatCAB subunit A, partial [Planctomycetaceae bacterium]|nr:Asp-tRNA(Asn)/Glu-tRNA(Gln) amidotransferase GatCAB subunit A [Planctomycetaceae bacterium]
MNRQSTRELIRQLNSGELSATQLTQACIDRIAALNGELNAFVDVDAEGALQQASEIDRRRSLGERVGRLAGLPIGIKDNICQLNRPTTCGSRMLKDFRPPYDAHVVERIRAEDGVIIGKLNQDEFAMGSSTETSVFGPARNPWN